MTNDRKEEEKTESPFYVIPSKHKSGLFSAQSSESVTVFHRNPPKSGQSSIPIVQANALKVVEPTKKNEWWKRRHPPGSMPPWDKDPPPNTHKKPVDSTFQKEKQPDTLNCEFLIQVYARALRPCREGVIDLAGKHRTMMGACEDKRRKLTEENALLKKEVEELRKELKILKERATGCGKNSDGQ